MLLSILGAFLTPIALLHPGHTNKRSDAQPRYRIFQKYFQEIPKMERFGRSTLGGRVTPILPVVGQNSLVCDDISRRWGRTSIFRSRTRGRVGKRGFSAHFVVDGGFSLVSAQNRGANSGHRARRNIQSAQPSPKAGERLEHPRGTVHFVGLHVLDNSFTPLISRAGISSTVDAMSFSVVENDFTVGLPVTSTSRPM